MANENKKMIFSTENPDGILVDMTSEELAVREQDSVNAETEKTNQTNLENLKASAKTKLMNGEALTEDEANVMVGL
tara:strand:+ start:271 stop:498 length:228 start_codon:yes stop_codon:yes gene_type:complete